MVPWPSAQLLVIPALSSINTLGAYADFPSLSDSSVVVLDRLINYEIFAAKSCLRVVSKNAKVLDRSKPHR